MHKTSQKIDSANLLQKNIESDIIEFVRYSFGESLHSLPETQISLKVTFEKILTSIENFVTNLFPERAKKASTIYVFHHIEANRAWFFSVDRWTFSEAVKHFQTLLADPFDVLDTKVVDIFAITSDVFESREIFKISTYEDGVHAVDRVSGTLLRESFCSVTNDNDKL